MTTSNSPTPTEQFVSDLSAFLVSFHRGAQLDRKRLNRTVRECNKILSLHPDNDDYSVDLTFSFSLHAGRYATTRMHSCQLHTNVEVSCRWKDFSTFIFPEEFRKEINQSHNLRVMICSIPGVNSSRTWGSWDRVPGFTFDLREKEEF
jgi:hypothetical protein